jgi:hypothetical protein
MKNKKNIMVFVLATILISTNFCYANNDVGKASKQGISSLQKQILVNFSSLRDTYNLVTAHQKGEIVLSADEILALKDEESAKIQNLQEKIQTLENNPNFQQAKQYLPKELLAFWNQAKIISTNTNLTTEEIATELIKTTDTNCNYYLEIVLYCLLADLLALVLAVTVIGIPAAVVIAVLSTTLAPLALTVWALCILGIV